MMRKAGRSRASGHAGRIVAILMPILGLAGGPARGAGVPFGVATMAAQAVGSQPRLVQLTAASRIGDKAPEGWTHLVLKSIPELKSGDLHTLPEMASKTATMFHTVIVADVQPMGLERQFILSRVGLGICVPAKDGTKDDVVVSTDRLEALSIKLSTVEQIVLETAEAELNEARIIAFTSTFALLRAPAMLLFGGKHHKVDLYYAFCVDPATGRLRVGAWSMWPGAGKQPPPPSVIDVAPRTVYQCGVDVQARRVLGVVPFSWTFAMQKLPPGQLLAIKGNKPLGEKIVAIARHPSDVNTEDFEKMLRTVLFAAPVVDPDAKTAKATTKRRTASR